MKFDKTLLLPGEEILVTKRANFVISITDFGLSRFVADGLMWTVGMEGKEAIGGKLYLTNYRLVFISHFLNRVRGSVSIFLPAITTMYDNSRRLVKNIIVETEVANFNFVVGGIPKLLMQMDDAKLNMKPQERQRLQVLLKEANSILVGGMVVNSGLERINKVLLMAKNGVDDFSEFDHPLDKVSSLLVNVAINNLEKSNGS